jgi:type 1 glutamine amidotransferase
MPRNVKRPEEPLSRDGPRRRLALATMAAVLLHALVAASASEDAGWRKRARLLMVAHSAGFQHDVVRRDAPHRLSLAEQAVADLAQRSGEFVVRHLYSREEVARLRPESFEEFDAVLFFTTGELPMGAEVRRSFFQFVRGGRALIGVHSASDTWHQVPEYADCLGGRFDGHPWHQQVQVLVEDRTDPATRHLGESFSITDEIYQFQHWARGDVHVLLRLDPRSVDVTRGARRDQDYALSWYRLCGAGRVFYTALGHRPEVWADERFRLHLLEGIRWALRLR